MKFLLHGNSPHVKTGYGVQLGYLGTCLKAAGHQVAFSATYGQQGSTGSFEGMPIFACGFDVNSNDLLHSHATYFFNDEPGWIITLIDVWAMTSPVLSEFNVAAWCPVDHQPVPPGVLKFFSESRAVPIAMSQFGFRELHEVGLDAAYIPLSVDTKVYSPTPTVEVNGEEITGRKLFGLPEDAFVVGMVAMNKGWSKDRKGFCEALLAFGQFCKLHDDVYLYMHTERFGGAEGINLVELAIHCGIPEKQLIWAGGPDQYGYRLGFTPNMMALTYSMFDVLLAPSHGEGFCVPLVEAQACGIPVIASEFSAQTELVDQGWYVHGQPEWDPPTHSFFLSPNVVDVLKALENAYNEDLKAMVQPAIDFAAQYDTVAVFEKYWMPFIETLEAPATKLALTREPMPDEGAVAVLCPVLSRPQNVAPLVESFLATTEPGEAMLYFVGSDSDGPQKKAVEDAHNQHPTRVAWLGRYAENLTDAEVFTYAESLNYGFEHTDEPWVLCIGDDVRFHDGWLDQARKLSGEWDVIGTNDTFPGRVKNPRVASGSHADHFFVRRAYVEEHGSSLEGPGILAPEVYRHWFTDREIVDLARARGVFSPCLDSVVEHLHPGYDGDEEARKNDPTYMLGLKNAEVDQETFMDRVPLIEMARTTRARV